MTIKQARQLKNNQYVIRHNKLYVLHIYNNKPNDLWFWRCNKKTREILQRRREGFIKRVCFGSKNLDPRNLTFLEDLQVVED